MKTKLIILGLLISSLGFGQVYSLDGGGGTATVDTTSEIASRYYVDSTAAAIVVGEVDLTGYVEWTDTTATVATQYDISGLAATSALTDYVLKTSLVDSAFTVAADLTGFLTGTDTTSLSNRIDAIDLSDYVAWTDTTAAIATQYDLTTVSGMSEGTVAGMIHDTVVNYVTQAALIDSAFVVAGDLTGYATQTYVTEALDTLSLGFDEATALDTIVGVQDGAMAVLPFDTDAIVVWSDTTSVIATQYDLTSVSGMSEETVAGMIHDTVTNYVTQAALIDSAFVVAGDITGMVVRTDTVSIFTFGTGGGLAADTALMAAGVYLGGSHNETTDTLVITKVFGSVLGGATDTLSAQIYIADTLGQVSPTGVFAAARGFTRGGNSYTSFSNSKIAPGKLYYMTISGVTAARKPELVIITMYGYRIRNY